MTAGDPTHDHGCSSTTARPANHALMRAPVRYLLVGPLGIALSRR
jgi:hypothetical protein